MGMSPGLSDASFESAILSAGQTPPAPPVQPASPASPVQETPALVEAAPEPAPAAPPIGDAPAEPAQPAEPSEPAEPAQPVEPAQPAEPDSDSTLPQELKLPWEEGEQTADYFKDRNTPEQEATAQARLDEALALDPADPKRNEAIFEATLKTNRGSQFYRFGKWARDAYNQFGGRFPSPEELEDFRASRVSLDLITEHYENGTPEQRRGLIEWMFEPNPEGKLRPGSFETAAQIPAALYRVNPDLYHTVEDRFLRIKMESLYRDVEQRRPAELDKDPNFITAEWMNKTLTGDEFESRRSRLGGAAPAAASNGHAAKLPASVQRELEEGRAAKQRAAELERGFQQSAVHALESDIDSSIGTLVDSTVFKHVNVPPADKQYIRAGLIRDIQDRLAQDGIWQREYQLERSNTLRSSSPQARASLVERVMQRAGAVLKRDVWPKFIEGRTQHSADTRKQDEAKRAKLENGLQHRAPTPGGAPAPAVAQRAAIERRPGEDTDDYLQRSMMEGFRKAGVAGI